MNVFHKGSLQVWLHSKTNRIFKNVFCSNLQYCLLRRETLFASCQNCWHFRLLSVVFISLVFYIFLKQEIDKLKCYDLAASPQLTVTDKPLVEKPCHLDVFTSKCAFTNLFVFTFLTNRSPCFLNPKLCIIFKLNVNT